jgi:hypothetical protein
MPYRRKFDFTGATAGKRLYRLTIQSKAVDALSVRPHSNAVFTAKPESGESARRLPNPRIPSACRKELRGTASKALCGAEGRVLLFFHRAPQAAQQPHGECFAPLSDAPPLRNARPSALTANPELCPANLPCPPIPGSRTQWNSSAQSFSRAPRICLAASPLAEQRLCYESSSLTATRRAEGRATPKPDNRHGEKRPCALARRSCVLMTTNKYSRCGRFCSRPAATACWP